MSDLVNHAPLRSTKPERYVWIVNFDTADTAAPDGISPTLDGQTIARTGVGVFTVTFAQSKRPVALDAGFADILGDEADLHCKVVSYVPSTGVLTVHQYKEDGTSGIHALGDSDNKTIQVVCYFTRSSLD